MKDHPTLSRALLTGLLLTLNTFGYGAGKEHTTFVMPQPEDEKETPLSNHGFRTGLQVMATPHSFQHSQSISPEYLLYLPEGYGDKDRSWPLVLFLHGKGERGTNAGILKRHGLPKIAGKKQFPFILVAPQCRPGTTWVAEELVQLIDELQSELMVDGSRLYVTGLSMGGYATWDLITAYPDTFAAAIPICGGADPKMAERIKHLPIWAFHGELDTTVPLEKAQGMVDRLKELGSEKLRFTVYEGCGHNSWTKAYSNQKLYQWLLGQSKD